MTRKERGAKKNEKLPKMEGILIGGGVFPNQAILQYGKPLRLNLEVRKIGGGSRVCRRRKKKEERRRRDEGFNSWRWRLGSR
jgi:hypothetical protein